MYWLASPITLDSPSPFHPVIDHSSIYCLEPMDDFNDIILYLLPHKGEGFDGAAFATAMPQNKSRFLAARRSDELESSAVPRRQERGGTELPVERGLLENTDCLAVRFSHGSRTRIGVVGGRALNAD